MDEPVEIEIDKDYEKKFNLYKLDLEEQKFMKRVERASLLRSLIKDLINFIIAIITIILGIYIIAMIVSFFISLNESKNRPDRWKYVLESVLAGPFYLYSYYAKRQ